VAALPERLFHTLSAQAGSPALAHPGGLLTADALLHTSENLSKRLGKQHCRVLAVLADNGPDWIAADLAAFRSGIPHLPLPQFFTAGQLAHALEAAGADCVLTDQPARIENLNLGFVRDRNWETLTWLKRDVAAKPLPAGTAKISFTSGSTGQPKGVCLSAAGLMDTAQALCETLANVPIDRHLTVLPLALLLENVAGVYAPLLRGAQVMLSGLEAVGWRGMSGFDPAALQQTVETTRPQSCILVPELLKAWTLWLAGARQQAPDGPRFIAVGGARTDPLLILKARGMGLPVYEGYGLTECGSVVSLNRPGVDRIGSAGRPLPHVGIRVDGTRQIHIESRALLGYLQETPSARGAWATGDLGHLDAEGYLRLSGRRRNLIITAYGRNVSPEWVEAALTAGPAIRQAMAFGEGKPWVSAVLVPALKVDRSALSQAVAEANATLPDYAQVHAWIEAEPFSPENCLATGNGRPIRAAIAARYGGEIDQLYHYREKCIP
jgi:long-chain acyl-CoA synthetase